MKNTFSTDDILLASFLLTQSISLVEIQENRPRHFIFLLSDPDKCNVLKREYLNNASAPAREIFFQREMLISEIKNRDGNGEAYGSTRK